MWMIPLPDGVMSVGAVCRPDYLKQRKGRTLEFLFETLRLSPALWRRVEHAEVIGNEMSVTGNYSYDSTQMGGPGWVLVGDAFAFLDPVFSSGVYLAMSGAEQAVDLADTALRDPSREAALLRKLEKRQRAGMARFSFFICRFNNPIMRQLFREPHGNIWQAGARRDIHAGPATSSIHPKVLWRLRAVQARVWNCRAAGFPALARRAQVPAGTGALGRAPIAADAVCGRACHGPVGNRR